MIKIMDSHHEGGMHAGGFEDWNGSNLLFVVLSVAASFGTNI